MHEQSLMMNLMNQIENIARREGATKVKGVKVWLGALSHMSKEHFREHFDQAAKAKVCAGASLDLTLSSDKTHDHAAEIILESIDVEED